MTYSVITDLGAEHGRGMTWGDALRRANDIASSHMVEAFVVDEGAPSRRWSVLPSPQALRKLGFRCRKEWVGRRQYYRVRDRFGELVSPASTCMSASLAWKCAFRAELFEWKRTMEALAKRAKGTP